MKNVLKFSFSLFILLLSHSMAFSQVGTCGQIVPFASEPRVDGCCVTFEMDLSIGTHWTLYPGNGLPQTESISSFDTNTNIITYCYDPVIQGTIYPNITYIDEFGKDICSSFYPVILDCTKRCGLASEHFVKDCCLFLEFYVQCKTIIRLYKPDGSPNGGSLFNPSKDSLTNHIKYCRDEPGIYTFTVECRDENDDVIEITPYSFEIGEECDDPKPRNKNAATEALSNGEFTVFPNPVTDQLTINAPNQVIENIMLFDLSNRLLINQKVNSDDVHTLDLNDIQASGIYYLHIVTDERSYNEKIVVQR